MPTQVIITYGATSADAKYSSVNIPIKTLCKRKCNRSVRTKDLYSQALHAVR